MFIVSVIVQSNCHILQDSAGILHGCLQQDGAPSHTARNTPSTDVPAAWERHVHRASHVPPNRPDLHPVDCAVWGALQQMVYQRRRFKTINQLKQSIVTEWGDFDFAPTQSVWPKISVRRGRPPPIIFAWIVRTMNVLQLCRWQFSHKETL